MSQMISAIMLLDDTPTGVAAIIAQIGSLLTSITGWLTSVLAWALGEPLILFFLALGIAGAMFRWARRLVHF